MKLIVKGKGTADFNGEVYIPGSKSHTIRAVFFASLAKGKSILRKPLLSSDANSSIETLKSFGAGIKYIEDSYVIEGLDGKICQPGNVIDVKNSGTTIRFALSLASLLDGCTILTGDEQIVNRPLGDLIDALKKLGATIETMKNNNKAPVIVKGKITKDITSVSCITSQYLSSLLVSLPFYDKDVEIEVPLLNEKPYVDITLWWLDKLGIKYENYGYKKFKMYGNQSINSFDINIPGDFSSATFFIVLASLTKSRVVLKNLDITDPQGDKKVLKIVEKMGALVELVDKDIIVTGRELTGIEVDMNDIPDALPAIAVLSCFAKGTTKLYNVMQARVKESDRIKVMHDELKKMGAKIEELEDGLIIRESKLKGAVLKGYEDHRIVMALSIAALMAEGSSTIDSQEAINVTFPNYVELMNGLGAEFEVIGDGIEE